MQMINSILKFVLPENIYIFLKFLFFKIISELDFIISDVNVFLKK